MEKWLNLYLTVTKDIITLKQDIVLHLKIVSYLDRYYTFNVILLGGIRLWLKLHQICIAGKWNKTHEDSFKLKYWKG